MISTLVSELRQKPAWQVHKGKQELVAAYDDECGYAAPECCEQPRVLVFNVFPHRANHNTHLVVDFFDSVDCEC